MEREPEVFICAKCDQKFTLKNNLKRHILKQHAAKSLKSPRMKLKGLCPICKTSAPDILYHFSVDHEIEIQSESNEFQDEISFLNWKKDVEKSTKSLYVISNSRKRKNRKRDSLTFRFTCHRSGEYKYKGKNIRRLKMKKSNKIGGCCPAGMHGTVDKYSQKRYVNFIKKLRRK